MISGTARSVDRVPAVTCQTFTVFVTGYSSLCDVGGDPWRMDAKYWIDLSTPKVRNRDWKGNSK